MACNRTECRLLLCLVQHAIPIGIKRVKQIVNIQAGFSGYGTEFRRIDSAIGINIDLCKSLLCHSLRINPR